MTTIAPGISVYKDHGTVIGGTGYIDLGEILAAATFATPVTTDALEIKGMNALCIGVDFTYVAATAVSLKVDVSFDDTPTTWYETQMADDSTPPTHTIADEQWTKAVSASTKWAVLIPVCAKWARVTVFGAGMTADTVALSAMAVA